MSGSSQSAAADVAALLDEAFAPNHAKPVHIWRTVVAGLARSRVGLSGLLWPDWHDPLHTVRNRAHDRAESA